MSNAITRREENRRRQDQWLAVTESGKVRCSEIALALKIPIRTVQWGISAARRRRDKTPQLPKLMPILGPRPWGTKGSLVPRVVEGGRKQCRICGSLEAHKRNPAESNIVAHSIVCAACHAVSPQNQRKIDAALNRQDVADTAAAINFKATAPKRHRKTARAI